MNRFKTTRIFQLQASDPPYSIHIAHVLMYVRNVHNVYAIHDPSTHSDTATQRHTESAAQRTNNNMYNILMRKIIVRFSETRLAELAKCERKDSGQEKQKKTQLSSRQDISSELYGSIEPRESTATVRMPLHYANPFKFKPLSVAADYFDANAMSMWNKTDCLLSRTLFFANNIEWLSSHRQSLSR